MKTIVDDFLKENLLDGDTQVRADIPGVTKSHMKLKDILEEFSTYTKKITIVHKTGVDKKGRDYHSTITRTEWGDVLDPSMSKSS